jgi:capsule polysaccharide export protein KpsE/RkpR
MVQRNLPVIETQSEGDFRVGGHPSDEGESRALMQVRLLWDSRRLILRFALWGFIAFSGIALLIPLEYDSATSLMPPDNDSGGASLLATLTTSRAASDALGGFAGDVLGTKTSGALFIGILRSRTVEDALVNKFDLRKLYHVRRWEDARRELEGRTSISEDRKSGIITIAVRDHSPQRAQAMAQAYVDQLNIAVATLSTSSARREREFLETRLKAVKQDLDQAAQDFSQFASKNTAIDIPEQGKAMVEAAARLQGELIAAEAQEQGLEQLYTANNARVRAAQANVDELRRQLDKLGGANSGTDATKGDDSLYPSIRQLPLLGVKYADLYRRTKIQEAVYETLTKQYELAKVQEAKEIPTVKVLDPPNFPEHKVAPHRTYIALFGLILSAFAACVWILGRAKWHEMDEGNPHKQLLREIAAGARQDFSTLRQGAKRLSNLRRSPFGGEDGNSSDPSGPSS